MSERTSQCRECTTVFPCGPTGRLPVLCPDCRKAPPDSPPVKRNGRRKAASNGAASPAIADAINALRGEIEALEEQITPRREALEALEAIA